MVEPPSPPVARRIPTVREVHGDRVVDDYEWLRDKEDPATVGYLEAENAYTAAQNERLAPLREQIFNEIKSRTQETDLSVPTRTGDFWYYTRTRAGQQYPVLCRTPCADPRSWDPPMIDAARPIASEQVLLDCNEAAEGHDFFALGGFDVSPDGRLLAYSVDVAGDERFTVGIRRLDTGETLPDTIAGTAYGLCWSLDASHLFYATVDDAWRPDRIWRHRIGEATTSDVCVLHEPDERFWVQIDRTASNRYLVLSCASKVTSEVRLLDAASPTAEPAVVIAREEGIEYQVDHAVIGGRDRLLVLHNREAENFTLGVGPVDIHDLDALETVLAHDPAVRLHDVHASRGAVVVDLRQDGLAHVSVLRVEPGGLGPAEPIPFDEPLFTASAVGFSDWEEPSVRAHYESWLTPRTVYDFDPATGELALRRQLPVPGYDPTLFVQSREWVTSRDGVQIPLSLVHHRDVSPRSDAPLLLYGYGSYESSTDPRLRTPTLSLLERGMVFAVAHVRGGGEMGRGWYVHGRQLEKRNTFNDFVDCARHLVETGWTSPGRLVAQGGSAGGLLMGAVANQAPDLFAGIMAIVPFVDALTSILDPSLPLTVIEWDEWGDPLHDPAVYAYMKSYTPYENLAAVEYPAIYATTSLNDTRVLYVEPAKWVARLRATVTSRGPILLKCEMAAGHGGVSGRYDAWREAADYLAWIVDVAGASPDPVHAVGGVPAP